MTQRTDEVVIAEFKRKHDITPDTAWDRGVLKSLEQLLRERPLPTTSGDEELVEEQLDLKAFCDEYIKPHYKSNHTDDYAFIVNALLARLAEKNQQIAAAKTEEREKALFIIQREIDSAQGSGEVLSYLERAKDRLLALTNQ